MATISTPIVEFNDTDNVRTWNYSAHSAVKPSLLIQKRRPTTGSRQIVESSLQVVQGSVDTNGVPLANKTLFSLDVRYPLAVPTADLDLAIANFRALVVSDEFVTAIKAQTYIKP